MSLAGICWKRSQAFQKVRFSALNSFFRNSWGGGGGWGKGGDRVTETQLGDVVKEIGIETQGEGAKPDRQTGSYPVAQGENERQKQGQREAKFPAGRRKRGCQRKAGRGS